MVSALKGSITLRAASRAFSRRVIGFTSGPLTKRSYQLIDGRGRQGAVCVFAADCAPGWALDAGGAVPAAGGGVGFTAAGWAMLPAGQGAVADAVAELCGWGASGSSRLALASAVPAHAGIAAQSNAGTSSARTA